MRQYQLVAIEHCTRESDDRSLAKCRRAGDHSADVVLQDVGHGKGQTVVRVHVLVALVPAAPVLARAAHSQVDFADVGGTVAVAAGNAGGCTDRLLPVVVAAAGVVAQAVRHGVLVLVLCSLDHEVLFRVSVAAEAGAGVAAATSGSVYSEGETRLGEMPWKSKQEVT